MNTRFMRIFSILCIIWNIIPAHYAYSLFSADEIKISPISMTANDSGLEITSKNIDRWIEQTELSPKQLEALGLKAGILNESLIRNLFTIGDDIQSRRFIDYFDSAVQFKSEFVSQQFPQTLFAAATEQWQSLLTYDRFLEDAIAIGGFDQGWGVRLRNELIDADKSGDPAVQVRALNKVRAQLYEVRQAAVRRARGYRQLAEILRRELSNREFHPNIAFVVEIRSASRQPTIAPLTEVTLECTTDSSKTSSTILFTQRKRDCNEYGVCKIESMALVSGEAVTTTLFDKLKTSGRSYLDSCQLKTKMLIDGNEIIRELPGKFTSHIGVLTP